MSESSHNVNADNVLRFFAINPNPTTEQFEGLSEELGLTQPELALAIGNLVLDGSLVGREGFQAIVSSPEQQKAIPGSALIRRIEPGTVVAKAVEILKENRLRAQPAREARPPAYGTLGEALQRMYPPPRSTQIARRRRRTWL